MMGRGAFVVQGKVLAKILQVTSIRAARLEDAEGIAFVHVESWKTTYAGIVPEDYLASLNVEDRAPIWMKQLRDPAVTSILAEKDGRIVGFACGGKLRERVAEFDAELYAIYLLRANQRHGLGTALLRTMAQALRDSGYQSLLVWVLEQNPAMEFYRTLGGSTVTEKMIDIGGVQLVEVALGWRTLSRLTRQ